MRPLMATMFNSNGHTDGRTYGYTDGQTLLQRCEDATEEEYEVLKNRKE